MKRTRILTVPVLLLTIASLMVISGCGFYDSIKNRLCGSCQSNPTASTKSADLADGSEVLVTIDGKPLITKNRFEREKANLIASNPQLQQVLAMVPAQQIDRNIIEGLTNQEVVNRYIEQKGINRLPEYLAEKDRMVASVEHMLNTKYFSQDFPTVISDAEARDFYEKNKNTIPQLLLSRGGVEASGVMFDKKEAAQQFMALVEKNAGNIDKAAQESGKSLKVQDFKVVNDQSVGIDPVLRDKIAAIKPCPAVKLFEITNNSFYVVSARKRVEETYRPFEQVKDNLKEYLEKEKQMQVFNTEIERLKQQYKIMINDGYFGQPEQEQPGMMPENTELEPALEEVEVLEQAPKAA